MISLLRTLFAGTPLPGLPDGQDWWVVESLRQGSNGDRFRIFEAVAGHSASQAAEHARQSDAALNRSLLDAALRTGEVTDPADWSPPSTLIRHRNITRVTTEGQIRRLDRPLIDMLREHDFFLDSFAEDPATCIGGGFYFTTKR